MLDSRFSACIAEGKLVKLSGSFADLVEKEFSASAFDLDTAGKSLKAGNAKWAIVQAYYSMFHTAKALVLSKGYREKSHACLLVALKALFVDANLLDPIQFAHFRDCMNLRHDADYGLIYSDKSAFEVIAWAEGFLAVARKMRK